MRQRHSDIAEARASCPSAVERVAARLSIAGIFGEPRQRIDQRPHGFDRKQRDDRIALARVPSLDRVRTLQHICLEVPDVAKAGEILASRPYPAGSKPSTPMATGVNGKRQINYYDPDGTRVEVMEPGTADGKPRPPATAPAPVGAPKPATPRVEKE